jgi:hypothetical protein
MPILSVAKPLNSRQLDYASNAHLPIQFIQQTQSKTDGTKVVNNNHRKQDGQVPNPDVHTKNSIKKVWENNDGLLNVTAELVDEKSEVKLYVCNLLGKKVAEIYQGLPTSKNNDGHFVFTSHTQLNLPKSVYIVVLQGNTFKLAEKFIVTK